MFRSKIERNFKHIILGLVLSVVILSGCGVIARADGDDAVEPSSGLWCGHYDEIDYYNKMLITEEEMQRRIDTRTRAWELIAYTDPACFLDDPERETMTDEQYLELKAVAESAIEGCATQYDKIKAICYFVADRTYYDYRFYDGENYHYEYPTYYRSYDVYTYQRTICAGYATLTKTLLNAIDIPCMYLYGYNHEYNAAYDSEQGRWIELDATWSSRGSFTPEGEWIYVDRADPDEVRHFDLLVEELIDTNHTVYGIEHILYQDIYYSFSYEDDWEDMSNWYLTITGSKSDEINGGTSVCGVPIKGVNYSSKTLKSVDLSDTEISTVCLKECVSLTEVKIPASLTYFWTYGCKALKSIDLSVCSALDEITDNAFYGCESLETVILPQSVAAIKSSAFEGCTSLKNVDFSNLSITEIGSYAFCGCESLETIKFPVSVEKIESGAFYNTPNLTEVEAPGNLKDVEEQAFHCWGGKPVFIITPTSPDAFSLSFTRDVTLCPYYYYVVFDGNGSLAGTKRTKCFGADNGYSLNLNGEIGLEEDEYYYKPGYLLTGWNTEADGSGAAYNLTDSYKNLAAGYKETVTLYAQWTPQVLKVNYYERYYGYYISTENPKTFTIEDDIVLKPYTKPGYVFEGWFLDYDYKTEIKKLGQEVYSVYSFHYLMRMGYIDLYAKWKEDTSSAPDTPDPGSPETPDPGNSEAPVTPEPNETVYQITYELKGGTAPVGNPSSYTSDKGVGSFLAPVRTGYVFKGWFFDKACKEKAEHISVGSMGDFTLYAKWKAGSYSIVFDANGGAGSMAPQTCTYGKTYALDVSAFTKAGHVPAGWNTKADGTGMSYSDMEAVKNLVLEDGGSVTLYAQWLAGGERIIYMLNGGANDKENLQYYTPGTVQILKDPVKEGYKFVGWFTSSKLKKGKVTKISAASTGTVTVYAKWSAESYTIKFDKNPMPAGTVKGSVKSFTVKTGKKASLRANTFTQKGYKFVGWNTEPDGSGIQYKNKASVKDICFDEDGVFHDKVTLYAQWSEVTYKITYKYNKGSKVTDAPAKFTISSDAFKLPEPERAGYTFAGWFTNKNCKKKYRIEQIETGTTKNVTVYAKWVKEK